MAVGLDRTKTLCIGCPSFEQGEHPVQDDGVGDGAGSSTTTLRHVPLVRTEGKKYANGFVWSVDQMLRDPRLLPECRDDVARAAEVAFGLEASLYFYVGYPCSDFASKADDFASEANMWVFVFTADCCDGKRGTVTHFDTGGFFKEYIHLDAGVDRRAHLESHHLKGLAGWQEAFRVYVDDYFDSSKAYVQGVRAKKADKDGRLLHKDNERRAWTWELQLYADHDIRTGLLGLWLLSDHKDLLLRGIREQPDAEKRRWRDALGIDRLHTPEAGSEYNPQSICRDVEEKIASWL